MANIDCSVSINEADSQIEIIGLAEDNLIIDISKDIEFTPLVIKLASLIDNETEINLTNNNGDELEDKSKLVLTTIDSIFESYNVSIREEAKVEMEEGQIDETNNQIQEIDDLPF